MDRTASAVWRGRFKNGSGSVSTSSGILSNVSPHDPARCYSNIESPLNPVGSTLFGRRMLLHYIEGDRRVRNRGSSPHLGRYPNGFHDLLFGRPLLTGASGMCTNAIRALCYMSNRDCDEIFCFSG